MALHSLEDKFENNSLVAVAIICLWAEAARSQIQAFQTAAENTGLQFSPDWHWEKASEGYFDREEIPELQDFCEAYTTDLEAPARDNAILAALWLSRAMFVSN